ncbi:MAG TPA: class E sortase [Nocardioidaceae bacterium]|nr:class E sortase [Nocardioidaceae bacterium]
MRSRRVMFWAGLGLIGTGLVLIGYFLWQFYGTNIVAKQKQEQNVEELTQLWANDPAAPTAEDGAIPLGDASALIRIPRFGDDYEMPVLEGTSDDVLAQGFAHFENSAGPGKIGNYALAAHRVTHGEPLRNMPDLRPGDEVIVETRQAIYIYELDTNPNDLIVPFTAGWVVEDFPVNPDGGVGPDATHGKRLITLTTCSEIFHTDNRMIAFGHLKSVERK